MDFKLIITWMFGLILVYLLATKGKAVQSLIGGKSGGVVGFVSTESLALQGR
jgi:hypothetical protein